MKKEEQKKAVAIKYERNSDSAPKVIAKGKHLIAEKIENIAKEHNIYIKKDENLVQDLYKLKINEEIPEELYEAVAKILVYIYNMDSQA